MPTPTCDVLRCDLEGLAVIAVPSPATVRNEALVCGLHQSKIDAGEPWTWDSDQRVMLLGADRFSGGALRLTGYEVDVLIDDYDSQLGGMPILVNLDALRADDTTERIELVMGPDQAARLSNALSGFTRRAEP